MLNPPHEDEDEESDREQVDFDINDPSLRCGIGKCRPSWLQQCADIRVYVLLYSLAAMVSSALGIYMISQVTTFERLLGLSSKEAGFLLSANDIGYLIVIVFASHLARDANKSTILGVLVCVFGVMAVVCGTPHFIMNSYKGLFYFTPDATTQPEDIGNETLSPSPSVMLCNANRTSQSMEAESNEDDQRAYVRQVAFAILALSLMIQGAVKAPRYPLSLTFIDDHVPKTKVGLYLGVSMAIVIFGLAVATGLGSLFSQIYVTLEDVGLTKRDPRWVGAWWVGFMGIGICACILAIPLLFFPKYLKTNRRFKKHVAEKSEETIRLKGADEQSVDEIHDGHKPNKEKRKQTRASFLKQELRDFPRALWRLITNPVFLCILLSNGMGSLGFVGRMVYFQKYLIVHFNMLPHQAILMFGITILVGAAVGSVVSGGIMSVFKMSPRTSLLFAIVIGTIATLLSFVGLALECPSTQFQGYDLTRLIDRDRLDPAVTDLAYHSNTSCAEGCGCTDSLFLPVCGDDGRNYFSPCHAGCNETSTSSTSFSNCTCMPESSNRTATAGYCHGQCSHLVTYLIFAFIGPFLGMLTVTPKIVVKLRCVAEKDRSLSVGVNSFVTNIMGSLLSPIFYGWIIDRTCVLWISNSCHMYDIADFRHKFHTVSAGIGLGADALYVIAYLIVIFTDKYPEFARQTKKEEDKDKELQKMQK